MQELLIAISEWFLMHDLIFWEQIDKPEESPEKKRIDNFWKLTTSIKPMKISKESNRH